MSLFCPSWRNIAASWKKNFEITLMHSSRTFLGTKKAISDNLVLVNMGLVPFSCSISGEIILGGIITVPLKSKLILETRNLAFQSSNASSFQTPGLSPKF